jgi:MFS family permease
VIALLLFTIKEPIRTNTLQRDGETAKLSLSESLSIVFRFPKAYLLICFATAAGALINYGSNAWIPTFITRTYGWDAPKAGFLYGIVLVFASISGVLFGGWYADRLVKKGVKDGRIRIALMSGIACILACFIPLLPKAEWALLAVFIPSFALTAPFGATTAAIQEIMPNQVRALASSIFLFILNLIGIGLGPTFVAVFTDYVFKDENMIRYSMMMLYLIGGIFLLILSIAALKPYKKAVEEINANVE